MARDSKEQREIVRAMSFLSQMGISIVICIAVGVFLGRFLDTVFGTSPWLVLIFSLLGSAAAFKSIFDMAKKG